MCIKVVRFRASASSTCSTCNTAFRVKHYTIKIDRLNIFLHNYNAHHQLRIFAAEKLAIGNGNDKLTTNRESRDMLCNNVK